VNQKRNRRKGFVVHQNFEIVKTEFVETKIVETQNEICGRLLARGYAAEIHLPFETPQRVPIGIDELNFNRRVSG